MAWSILSHLLFWTWLILNIYVWTPPPRDGRDFQHYTNTFLLVLMVTCQAARISKLQRDFEERTKQDKK